MKYIKKTLHTTIGRTTLFCATALLLAACGGGGTEKTDETGENDISLIGIPKSMVSAVCLDSNSNLLCEATEELDYRYDFGGASIYEAPRNPPVGKEILVVVSDPAKTNFFDKSVLAFPSDSKELSMQKLTDWEYTPIDAKDYPKEQANLELFLGHQQNLNLLGQNGLSAEEAGNASLKEIKASLSKLSDADIKAMAEELVNLKAESEGGGRTYGREEFQDLVMISPDKAYEIAKNVRGEEKGLVNDKLVENYQCKTGLVKTVQHYGVEDVFDLSNGAEQAYPSSDVLNWPNVIAYNNNVNQATTSGYDETSNNRIFADSINNLPAGIVSGRIYIGLKSNGSSLQHNDTLAIGKYGTSVNSYFETLNKLKLADGTGTQPYSTQWQNQLVNTTNPTTDVLWNDFNRLKFTASSSLLDYVQTSNNFDVVVQDDTSVDFITVATCSEKKPVEEITQVLENFQCKASAGPDNETRVTIVGGIVDAFANGSDSATPSSALVNAVALTYSAGTTDYDATSYDKAFLDTLTLPTGGYITRARLSVGVKALGSSLHSNDTINFGYTNASDRAPFKVYGNAPTSVNTQWNVTPISNGERVIQTDFNLNMFSGAAALPWLRNQSELDIVLQDDTSVDFVQLDLCMTEKPPFVDTDHDGYSDEEEIEAGSNPENPDSTPNDLDGDGVPNEKDCDPLNPDVWEDCEPKLPASCDKNITVDLSPASSWIQTATGSAPTVGNVFTGTPHVNVWDPALNWFNFGSASNTTHELKIDFCSCGEGSVKVDEMKSDNYSSVTLDGQAPIVERTAYSQSTMATWGPSVSGTQTIPYSGNGVDRSLIFKVKNVGGPSGGGIDGTLNFTGHLGSCTKEDVLPK